MSVIHIEKALKPVYKVRIGPDNWKYGDPFDICLTMEGDPPEGEIGGLDKKLTLQQRRELKQALIDYGYKVILITRYKNGKKIIRKIIDG